MASKELKLHWLIKGKYACNGACNTTKHKIARRLADVTCNNCRLILRNAGKL